jgi:hypothetical protein
MQEAAAQNSAQRLAQLHHNASESLSSTIIASEEALARVLSPRESPRQPVVDVRPSQLPNAAGQTMDDVYAAIQRRKATTLSNLQRCCLSTDEVLPSNVMVAPVHVSSCQTSIARPLMPEFTARNSQHVRAGIILSDVALAPSFPVPPGTRRVALEHLTHRMLHLDLQMLVGPRQPERTLKQTRFECEQEAHSLTKRPRTTFPAATQSAFAAFAQQDQGGYALPAGPTALDQAITSSLFGNEVWVSVSRSESAQQTAWGAIAQQRVASSASTFSLTFHVTFSPPPPP